MLYTYYDRSEKHFESASTLQDDTRGSPEVGSVWSTSACGLRPDAITSWSMWPISANPRPMASIPTWSCPAEPSRNGPSAASLRTAWAHVAAPEGGVVLYATAWCPACKAARRWLTDNKVPFVEKDVEKDPAAAEELMQRARAAGLSTSGVPVLDIRGNLIQGFDPERIRALLRGTK